MKNHLRFSSTVVALAMLAALAGPVSAQQPPIEFKVGISDPVNTVLPVDGGGRRLLCGQGLKVEIVNMNGGSKGARELQAGRIDVMHVGLSSVIRLNRSGGDLRLIASLSNVIRFIVLLRTRREDRGRPQGRRGRRQHLRLRKRFHRDAGAAAPRAHAQRRDVKEYGGGSRAARRDEVRRDQGDRGQRAVHQLAREQGVNVLVDLAEQIPWVFSGIVVRHSDSRARARPAQALPQGDDRGQLSRAHRREARQGGAGQGAASSPIRRSSTSATTISSRSRRPTSSRRRKARRTSWPVPGRQPATWRTTSTSSLLDEIKKDGFFTGCSRSTSKR